MSLADRLAGLALQAHREPVEESWLPLRAALLRLDDLAGTGPEEDLRAWAGRVADPRGELPLLGAGVRAAPYPALLWNGSRCDRAALGREAALALVGLAAGSGAQRSAADLARAVRAGQVVGDAVESLPAGDGRPVAAPTTDVVAAATCAALVGEVGSDALPALLDLAGSLMVVTPPRLAAVPVGLAGLWAGHALAAGWLAARAQAAGVLGMPGGLAHTLSVVADRPVGALPAPGDRPGLRPQLRADPADVPLRSLVAALG